MEKKKSLVNVASSILSSLANVAIGFFAQRIFLAFLNTEYLGLNGLFTNIISMLAILELGIGSAITFSLYKPLAHNDRATIKALMLFYKKAYRIIALVVASIGLVITPFLPLLIKEVTIDINIYVVYLLFILDVICSYLLTYRRSILYADQKNYQINIVHICYLVIMNAAQLSVLALTKNYYLYLGTKIIARIAENLIIHLLVHRQYAYLDNLKNAKLEKIIEKDIYKKIKALFFHKIGTFIILGTDNLIISKFIGLIEVGLYSNYYLVINATNQLVGQAITALTPTVGRKLATEKSENSYNAFKKTRFAGFVLACIISVGFFVCIQPLIKIWLGEQYLFGFLTIAMLSLNMFQKLQRYAYSTFKEAGGIYHEDRFVPLIESVLNIAASIILLQFFGVAGVFMGTIISGLALWCYSYPKFVYKRLFGRSYFSYAKETLGYIAVFIACATASIAITSCMHLNSNLAQLILNAVISLIVCIVIICATLSWTNSFKYFAQKIKRKK